jgi:hypothetical protein
MDIGVGFQFTFSRTSGAILALPRGCASSTYCAIDFLKNYIERHARNWFHFVDEVTLESHRELRIITSVHHAPSWALAVQSSAQTSAEFSLRLNVSGAGGGSGKFNLTWAASNSGEYRVCSEEQCSPDALWNQAVFVTSTAINRPLKDKLKKRSGRLVSRIERWTKHEPGSSGHTPISTGSSGSQTDKATSNQTSDVSTTLAKRQTGHFSRPDTSSESLNMQPSSTGRENADVTVITDDESKTLPPVSKYPLTVAKMILIL